MPDLKNPDPIWHKVLKIVPFGLLIGIGVLIAGIITLCIQQNYENHEKKCNGTRTQYNYEYISSVDYSNCKNAGQEYCHTYNLTKGSCPCNVALEVPKFVEGDVVLSYSLDTFFDDVNKLKLLSSRDDLQLSGILNTTVSSSCASPDYDYHNGKPIAPCGALADAMFNDTIGAIYHPINATVSHMVPKMVYGLLHDNEKIGFKNPPGVLATAFQNFTRPISWQKSIWELDTENPNNNGFQNEAFIVWMRYNELPIRPIWRLNRTANENYAKGLPPSTYVISMYYTYPPSLYSGPRKLTLYREVECEAQKSIGFGVAAVVIGVIILATSAALLIAYKVKAANDEKMTQPVKYSSPETSASTTPTPNPNPETIETNNSVKENGHTEEKLLSKEATTSAREIEPEQKPLNDIKEEEEYL